MTHATKRVSAEEANLVNLPCKYGHMGRWYLVIRRGINTRVCKECKKIRGKAEHAKDPERYIALALERHKRIITGLCRNCTRPAIVGRKLCVVCAEITRISGRKHVKVAKEIVFNFYGKTCACCGEPERGFLTLDHINNDGKQDALSRTRNTSWYLKLARLIRQGHPQEGLRTMCYNCNCGRSRNGGICPHEEQRERET